MQFREKKCLLDIKEFQIMGQNQSRIAPKESSVTPPARTIEEFVEERKAFGRNFPKPDMDCSRCELRVLRGCLQDNRVSERCQNVGYCYDPQESIEKCGVPRGMACVNPDGPIHMCTLRHCPEKVLRKVCPFERPPEVLQEE